MIGRPYQPPSLLALIADEDGSTAARLLSEERIRKAALASGRQQGLEEGLRQGREEGVAAARANSAWMLRSASARPAGRRRRRGCAGGLAGPA